DGGTLLPLGWPHAAHKGFGLAWIVDILAGVLTGSAFARDVSIIHGTTGQFFWALDPEVFLPRDEFLARVDAQIEQIKASEPAAAPYGAKEILVRGGRGHARRAALQQAGVVPLSEPVWQLLAQVCTRLSIPLPDIG